MDSLAIMVCSSLLQFKERATATKLQAGLPFVNMPVQSPAAGNVVQLAGGAKAVFTCLRGSSHSKKASNESTGAQLFLLACSCLLACSRAINKSCAMQAKMCSA
jgi:hypothetical protein